MVSHSATAILLLTIAVLSSSCMGGGNILYSGEVLNSGTAIQYGNRRLTMQRDCNLVLYDAGNPIWASNTGGLATNCYCTMQSDGNLVVYTQSGNPIWASNTGGASGRNFVLVLQSDRNLVIYGPALWATGTNINSSKLRITPIIATNGTNARNNTTASVLLMKGGTNETNNTPTI